MKKKDTKQYRLGLVLLLAIVSSFYLRLQVETIYGGDAGDLVSAIIVRGIPHPPGYPLYTLLGIILTKVLWVGTMAWRVGFLSSIPAIFAIVILYDLIHYLTGKAWVGFVSCLVLSFSYLFWLYGVVVEVFSLNNFFSVSLLWCLFHWAKEGKNKYLYFASLLFGLALSHHHIILFLVPTLLILLLQNKRNINRKIILGSSLLFLVGLLPYVYILITSYFHHSFVNWMGSLTFSNFVDLITRARYGTFQSGAYYSQNPTLRLLGVIAFFDFATKDFRVLGMILFLLGILNQIKMKSPTTVALLIGFCSYLFFLFYASFPLVDNFLVATYERFLLPLYVFIPIFISFGLIFLLDTFDYFLEKVFGKNKRFKIVQLISVSFFIYPLGLFLINNPKIRNIKKDFTAENLGRDILSSIPKNGILLLSTDTPLFDTQYVYYSEGARSDVALVHLTELYLDDDLKKLKLQFSELEFPDQKEDITTRVDTFLKLNAAKFQIYSKFSIASTKGQWIPYGLVFKYVMKDEKLPEDSTILSDNKQLWSIYHEPNPGIPVYNLMVSDVIPQYAIAHQELGYWAAKRKYSKVAETHLLAAEKLYPADLDSYIILAQSYMVDGQCKDADSQMQQVSKRNKDDQRIYYLEAINYAVCFKDKEKSKYYQDLYEQKKHEQEIPLKKL